MFPYDDIIMDGVDSTFDKSRHYAAVVKCVLVKNMSLTLFNQCKCSLWFRGNYAVTIHFPQYQ